MKTKTFIISILFFGFTSIANSQNNENTDDLKHFLPKTGDYALQMDAAPILNFALNAVNIMNDNGSNAQHPGFVSGMSNIIVGKYFVKDNAALRLRVGFNTLVETEKEYGDNPLTPTAIANGTAENILLSTSVDRSRSYILGAGYEFRRGGERLQGYYGGDLNLMIQNQTSEYTYEIAYNNQSADSGYIFQGSERDLSYNDGLQFTLNLRGFVGVEYFIIPKISLGAEFGFGYSMYSYARGDSETEYWDIAPGSNSTTPSAYTETESFDYIDRERGFTVDNGFGGVGALNVTFHF